MLGDSLREASDAQVPQVAVKEERRVLWYASDGLSGKMRCLGAAQPPKRCRRSSI